MTAAGPTQMLRSAQHDTAALAQHDTAVIERPSRSRNIVFLVVFIALMALGREKMFRDPGTLWHTVVGERMLQTGEIIRKDWFSFSQPGYPWIAQQWLGECAMAAIHRLAGLDGLLWASATLIGLLFASLAGRFARTALPWPMLGVLLLLVFAGCSYHFIPRPHLVTLLLMAWTFGSLCDVEAGRKTSTHLLWLPAAFVFWTNIHGGMLGGLITVLFVLGGWLVVPSRFRHGSLCKTRNHVVLIGMTASACVASALVNPYGAELPATWLRLMNSKVLPKLIIEHAPLRVLSVEGLMLMSLAVVYVTILVTTWRRHRRWTCLVPLLWLAMALSRVRHGPIFAITAAIAIAEMLPSVARFAAALPSRIAAKQSRGSYFNFQLSTFNFGLLPIAAVILTVLLQVTGTRCPVFGAGWVRLDPAYWPVEAVHALQKQAKNGSPVRVFNEMRYGGYLTYMMPQAKTYIDDRCELYGDWFLQDFTEVRGRPQRMDALAAYYKLDAAVVSTGSRLDTHLSKNAEWIPVHRDNGASLFMRRSSNAVRRS